MVGALNSEITQLAAFMSNSLRFTDTALGLSEEEMCSAIEHVTVALVISSLIGLLQSPLHAAKAHICSSIYIQHVSFP